MEKKRKVGMSGVNWFLSILGIILFSSIIFLPPIFRAVFQDKDIDSTVKEDFKQVKEMTICSKKNSFVDTEYIIDSTNDSVDMFAQSLIYHYDKDDDKAFEVCSDEASRYQGIPGVHHGCRIDEGNMIVESRIQISEYNGEEIPVSFDVKEKASVLKSSFLDAGFQCETKTNE